jgi:hypothetical protein
MLDIQQDEGEGEDDCNLKQRNVVGLQVKQQSNKNLMPQILSTNGEI